jgi:hypothetical protein
MSFVTLPKGVILQIEAKDPLATPASTSLSFRNISDHNRSEFSATPMRIEKQQRMSNGSLRKFYVADKMTFNVSWSMLPSYRAETADGYWGAEDLRQFYASDEGKASFRILLNFAKGGTKQDTELLGAEPYTVVFKDFSAVVVKRGINAFWNVSMTLEEV